MSHFSNIRLNRSIGLGKKKQPNTLNIPVLGLAILITSFFYCLPLVRLSLGKMLTDIRLYDLVFLGFSLFIGLPYLNRLQILLKKRRLFFKWGMLLIFLVFASLLITALMSGLNSLAIASIRAFRFFMYLATPGFLFIFINTPAKQKFLLNIFYINIVLQMILAILQYYALIPNLWPEYWLRSYGALPVGTLSPHHKHIGVVMLLGVGLSLFYLQNSHSLLTRSIVLVLMAGMITVMVFSVSRTSWLGMVALMGTFLFIQKLRNIIPFTLIALGLAFFFFISPSFFRADLQSEINRVFIERIERQGVEGVTGDRMMVYDNYPTAIKDSPWILITGTGFQNISYALGGPTGAHNNYAQAWFELGIVGFIVYMTFLYKIVINLQEVRKQKITRFQYLLASNILAGFAGVLATMLVGESLWAQYSMFTLSGQIMIFVTLGCVSLLWRKHTVPD